MADGLMGVTGSGVEVVQCWWSGEVFELGRWVGQQVVLSDLIGL